MNQNAWRWTVLGFGGFGLLLGCAPPRESQLPQPEYEPAPLPEWEPEASPPSAFDAALLGGEEVPEDAEVPSTGGAEPEQTPALREEGVGGGGGPTHGPQGGEQATEEGAQGDGAAAGAGEPSPEQGQTGVVESGGQQATSESD